MSDVTTEISLLDQMKQQHAAFTAQRDQALANLQQLMGAIYACEVMIKKHEDMGQEQPVSDQPATGIELVAEEDC